MHTPVTKRRQTARESSTSAFFTMLQPAAPSPVPAALAVPPIPPVPAIRRILAVTAAAYGLDPAVDHRRPMRRPGPRGEAANRQDLRRHA